MPATETRVTPPEIRLPARGGELRLAARPEMRLANPDGRHAADVVLPYLVLMQGLQYTRFGLVNMRVPSMCGIPVRRVSEGTGVLHQCSTTSSACLPDGRHAADVVLPCLLSAALFDVVLPYLDLMQDLQYTHDLAASIYA